MNTYVPPQADTRRLSQGCNVRLAPADPQATRVYLLTGAYNAIHVRLVPSDPKAVPIFFCPEARNAVPICFI